MFWFKFIELLIVICHELNVRSFSEGDVT